MKVIYPEETLALLAKYDDLIDMIRNEYQRIYPDPPDFLREVLGEQAYAEKYREVLYKRHYATLEDRYYQACIRMQVKIISLSPCTYQFVMTENSHTSACEAG